MDSQVRNEIFTRDTRNVNATWFIYKQKIDSMITKTNFRRNI